MKVKTSGARKSLVLVVDLNVLFLLSLSISPPPSFSPSFTVHTGSTSPISSQLENLLALVSYQPAAAVDLLFE